MVLDPLQGKKDFSELDQSKEEEELVNFVRAQVEEVRASASRIAHEGVWMSNIAALLGYNGMTYNSVTRQFAPTGGRAGTYKQQNTNINRILPTIQNRLAKLCKNKPKFDVIPESNSTDDKEAARLSLDVLDIMWQKLSLDEKRVFLYMFMQQCGHAYIKICWDPSKGNIMQNPETGELDTEGDIRCDIVSAFETFPDPLAKTSEDLAYLTQAKIRKLDYFRSQYPEKGHLVKEEDCWLMSLQYDQRINSMNVRGSNSGTSNNEIKGCAIELTRYERRSKKYPNGRMIVTANGILLENKDLPVGEIPFAKFDDVVIGGKYNSEAIITHIRPVQDQYNELIRRRFEWVRKLLAGKYKAARGIGLAQESLNNESGEIYYYTPVPNAPNAGAPEPMNIPTIPQYAYNEEDRLDGMINDISGISEISRGTLPSASIPALGMSILQEADDSRIGVETDLHEINWAKVGSLILKYAEKYYVMPRKMKFKRGSSTYDVREFVGEELKGNTEVLVVPGSMRPGSKTLKRQDILNAYQQGLLGDPADPKVRETVLQSIEFGDIAELWQDFALDAAQIKKGITLIEQGGIPQVNEFDNHPQWMKELNRYRKGEKFETLQPEQQQIVIDLINAHTDMIVNMSNMVPPPPAVPEEGQGLVDSGMNPPSADVGEAPPVLEEQPII